MFSFRLVAALPFALALAGCGDGGGAGLEIRARSSALDTVPAAAPALTFADATGRVWTLREASVRVTDIELKLPRGVRCSEIEAELAGGVRCDRDDDDHDEVEIRGPFVVDLLTGASTPSLDEVRVPALTYREVEFDLNGSRGVPGLYLRATADDGAAPESLELRMREAEVEIERRGGVEVQSGANLVILLDAATWLEGLPVAACLDDRGVVRLDDDDDRCDDLEDALEDRLDDACSFDDDDWDDDRDDDDDDDDDRDDDDDDDRDDD